MNLSATSVSNGTSISDGKFWNFFYAVRKTPFWRKFSTVNCKYSPKRKFCDPLSAKILEYFVNFSVEKETEISLETLVFRHHQKSQIFNVFEFLLAKYRA